MDQIIYLFISFFIISFGIGACTSLPIYQEEGKITNGFKSPSIENTVLEYKKIPDNWLERYWLQAKKDTGYINSWNLKAEKSLIFFSLKNFPPAKENTLPWAGRGFVYSDSIIYSSILEYGKGSHSPNLDFSINVGDTIFQYNDNQGRKKTPMVLNARKSCLGGHTCYYWDRIGKDGKIKYSITFLYEIGVYEYFNYENGKEESWVLNRIDGQKLDKWLQANQPGNSLIFSW